MEGYIGRESAIKAMLTRFWDSKETLREIMDSVPAANVAPVVHAEWIPDGDKHSVFHKCSVCDSFSIREENSWGDDIAEHLTPYCPFCGAEMDADEHD